MRKAIRMMKIRLTRWMRQRPIRFPTAFFLDHRRQTELPNNVTWQAQQLGQLQASLQRVACGARLHLDPGRAYLARNTHPATVTAEPIGRPLCRGRKVEFVIPGAGRGTDKRLEAGVAPKPIGARTRHYGRQAQIVYLAVHEIMQNQPARTRTYDIHLDVCRCEATRVGMKS